MVSGTMSNIKEFDYIVVGAGAGGCVDVGDGSCENGRSVFASWGYDTADYELLADASTSDAKVKWQGGGGRYRLGTDDVKSIRQCQPDQRRHCMSIYCS
jgi:hypothetical protein